MSRFEQIKLAHEPNKRQSKPAGVNLSCHYPITPSIIIRRYLATWEANVEQPAPKALKEMLARVFMDTRFCKRMEIFNPGHGDGSAIDIFLNVGDASEYTLACKLIQLFVENKQLIKWGAVIYNRQTWDNRGGPVPYEQATRMPHTDHIHIEWGKVGRMTRVFPGLEDGIKTIRDEVLQARTTKLLIDWTILSPAQHLYRLPNGSIRGRNGRRTHAR
jgi:hypothetical protein